MSNTLCINQIEEGSILFNKPFSVKVSNYNTNSNFKYNIYENNILLETFNSKEDSFSFYPKTYSNYKIVLHVFEEKKFIKALSIPILDYIEDFISIKNVTLDRKNNNLTATVNSNINTSKEQYAYYLMKENIAIEKVFYTKSQTCTFNNLPSGKYYVRIFIRLMKNNNYCDKITLNTNIITI